MTKRQPHEFQRPIDIDTSSEDSRLRDMEARARNGENPGRNFAGKWLTVFMKDGEMVYRWEGGYPTQYINRATAVSILQFFPWMIKIPKIDVLMNQQKLL